MAQEGSPVNSIDLLSAAGVTELAVANTDTAYSYSFPSRPGKSFGLLLKFSVSSGSPNVKVEVEQGQDRPGTEGSADTNNFAVGQSADCVIDSGANTTGLRFYPFPPIVAPYQRLKFTGLTGNAASTKVAIAKIFEV